MKAKTAILLISLLLNLALAGMFVLRNDSSATPAPGAVSSSSPATASATKGASVGGQQAVPKPEVWTKVYDKDPASLLANLKAAGFPPRVIRAIMAASVSEQFAARRKELFAEVKERPFWQAKGSANYELYAKMQVLQREQSAMLKQLLGSDYTAAIEENADYYRRMYGNLPAEKIEALQMVSNDFNELRYQLQAEANGIYLPEDREKLAMLEKERQADLKALLSPEEYAEYEMRSSTTANRMRSQLSAFDFTEQEFRSVFEILRGVDEKQGNNLYGVSMNSQMMADRRAAEQQAQSAIKEVLGEQRYQEYQRASNNYYRTASQIADRLQIPRENAVAVYDLSRTMEQQARSIMQNNSLSRDAQQQALHGMAVDMDAKLKQYLTPKGAEAFKQTAGGNWQRYLTPPTPRPNP